MGNIIVKALEGGFFHLSPSNGYKLYSEAIERFVSEAVVKEENIGRFSAVKDE